MAIDHSKSVLENAYNLWRTSEHYDFSNEVPEAIQRITAIHRIANTLFSSMKKDKWYSGILSLFSRLLKARILRTVKRALAAYKFDLITSSTQTPNEAWLFNDNEQVLIKEFRPIFKKNLLHKTRLTTIDAKAKRWKSKVKKYYSNPRYLLASYGLTAITERLPHTKSLINRVIKPFGPKSIQALANWMLKGRDPSIEQGLTNLLGREDFSFRSPFGKLLQKAFYEIGKQKIKNVADRTLQTYSYCRKAAKDKAYNAVIGLRDVIYSPFMGSPKQVMLE